MGDGPTGFILGRRSVNSWVDNASHDDIATIGRGHMVRLIAGMLARSRTRDEQVCRVRWGMIGALSEQ